MCLLALNWWTLWVIHCETVVLPELLQTNLAIHLQFRTVNGIKLAEMHSVIIQLHRLHLLIEYALGKHQQPVHIGIARERRLCGENIPVTEPSLTSKLRAKIG